MNVLLGDLEEENTFINNITILLGKIYIFRTKSADFLHINRFKHFLKHNFIIESHIANKNGTDEQLLSRGMQSVGKIFLTCKHKLLVVII